MNLRKGFFKVVFKVIKVVFLLLIFFVKVLVLNNTFLFLHNVLNNWFLNDLCGGLTSDLTCLGYFLFFFLDLWYNLMS